MNSRSNFVQLADFNAFCLLPRRDLITIPLKPSRAVIVAQKDLVIAIIAMIWGHPRNQRCIKVVRRVRQNGDVLLFAAAVSAGERLSTQLKTKNITVSTIMM